jgi:RHS repeat-associated protein
MRKLGTKRLVGCLSAFVLLGVNAGLVFAAGPVASGTPSSPPGGHGRVSPLVLGSPMVLPHGGSVVVQITRTLTAASTNDLSLSQPFSQFLSPDISHHTVNVAVGTFNAGDNLVFSLHSSFTGQDYLTTGDHAQVTQFGPDAWAVGWEDWVDQSYNDAEMVVCFGTIVSGCPLAPAQTFGPGSSGSAAFPQATQAEPVNTATGNYTNHAIDAALPGRGLGFEFSRTYNSLSTDVGVLGIGWTHSYASSIQTNADGSATYISENGSRAVYASDGAGGYLRPPGAYGVLTPVGGGGFDLLKKNQVRLRFDASGRLTSETDRNGNTVTLGYVAGQLTTITDTVGRVITLGYDGQGHLASLAFPPSRTLTYQYDASGRLWKVTDPENGVTTFTYDAQSRLATITDANNHQLVANTYGTDGRVSEQVDARGYHTLFAWDSGTQTSTMTDARGGQWIDRYNYGILVSSTDPVGDTTQYSFDANLGMSAKIDANGHTWPSINDSFGNILLRKYPTPADYSESWTYNARNDPLTHVDRRGNTTTYTYDAAGNLKTVTGPAPVSPATTYNYDPAGTGLMLSVVDPRGKTTSFAYDAQGNRNQATTPLGNITTMTFDAAGRMLTRVEPRGNVVGGNPAQYTTTFTYDGLDRLRTTTTPLGAVTTVAYDPAGNRTSVTDGNNHATTYAYDAANNLTTVTDALLKPTTYAYDEVGNQISRTDANSHLTSYTYDLAKRMLTETQPLGRTWTYTYSPTGKVTKVVDPIAAATPDPSDYQVINAYDELDRLVSADFGASGTTTYGYDANDNRTSVVNPTGTATYGYDVLNRLSSYRFGSRGIDYIYDQSTNVTKRTYTDGTVVDLAYDNDARLATVTSAGAVTTYGYDAAGNLTSTTLPAANGYVETRTYDRTGRLTEVKNQKGAAVLSRSTYTLDPAGNTTSTQTTTETTNYQYDADNRVTEACYTASCTGGTDPFRRYTFDPVGNRLTEARSAGTTTFAYDALDELTQATGFGGTVNYTYDLDGRTLVAGTATSTWTRQGWLQTFAQGGTTTTNTYDGTGMRFQASTGSQNNKKVQFDWDPSVVAAQLVAERDGAGSLTRRYVNGYDAISVFGTNKTGYFHYDGLGSVVNVTSSTGTTWWTYTYFPFGVVRAETKNNNQALDNVLRFAGEYRESSGLYYLRARYYDPGIGRFTSPDAMRQGLDMPYQATCAYANNNPVRYVDPLGLESQPPCPDALERAGRVLAGLIMVPGGLLVTGVGVVMVGAGAGEVVAAPAEAVATGPFALVALGFGVEGGLEVIGYGGAAAGLGLGVSGGGIALIGSAIC